MLKKKTRNDRGPGWLVGVLVLLLCSTGEAAHTKTPKDIIKPCQISLSREAREATFVVLYKFETKNGKPLNIGRVKNDFLGDDEFIACISGWSLPSLRGQGLAEFFYKHAEGWTEITVSGKDFRKVYRFEHGVKESREAPNP